MAVQIPNGAQFSVASTIAAPVNVTAATNASPCVLTATNTYIIGDFVEYISGWSLATNRVYRVSAVSGTSVTLEGLDTTSTANYPVGGGVGTVRKITTWTQILQILDASVSGGDIQTGSYQFLENTFENEFTTVASAAALEFRIGDDTSLGGYQAYRTVALTRAQTPMRVVLPNGGILLYTGIASLNENPSLSVNEIMSVNARFSIAGRVNRY